MVSSTVHLFELRSLASRNVDEISHVVSTCGGIFGIKVGDKGMADRDLLNDVSIDAGPYYWFRCSSDRRTVVGTSQTKREDLLSGVPSKRRVAPAGSFNAYGFNISPDGSRIAYYHRQLCVSAENGTAECSGEQGTFIRNPSVRDSGEVLVTTGTGQECFNRSDTDFSPKRFPGATDENRGPCFGIGYWKPGLKSIQVFESIGSDPQWINPVTAQLLRDWAARNADPSHAKPSARPSSD